MSPLSTTPSSSSRPKRTLNVDDQDDPVNKPARKQRSRYDKVKMKMREGVDVHAVALGAGGMTTTTAHAAPLAISDTISPSVLAPPKSEVQPLVKRSNLPLLYPILTTNVDTTFLLSREPSGMPPRISAITLLPFSLFHCPAITTAADRLAPGVLRPSEEDVRCLLNHAREKEPAYRQLAIERIENPVDLDGPRIFHPAARHRHFRLPFLAPFIDSSGTPRFDWVRNKSARIDAASVKPGGTYAHLMEPDLDDLSDKPGLVFGCEDRFVPPSVSAHLDSVMLWFYQTFRAATMELAIERGLHPRDISWEAREDRASRPWTRWKDGKRSPARFPTFDDTFLLELGQRVYGEGAVVQRGGKREWAGSASVEGAPGWYGDLPGYDAQRGHYQQMVRAAVAAGAWPTYTSLRTAHRDPVEEDIIVKEMWEAVSTTPIVDITEDYIRQNARLLLHEVRAITRLTNHPAPYLIKFASRVVDAGKAIIKRSPGIALNDLRATLHALQQPRAVGEWRTRRGLSAEGEGLLVGADGGEEHGKGGIVGKQGREGVVRGGQRGEEVEEREVDVLL